MHGASMGKDFAMFFSMEVMAAMLFQMDPVMSWSSRSRTAGPRSRVVVGRLLLAGSTPRRHELLAELAEPKAKAAPSQEGLDHLSGSSSHEGS